MVMKTQHTAFQSLPVVDISGLYSETLSERQACAQSLGQAARDAGFLYIQGHPIAQAQIDALFDCAKSYFAQPLAEKMRHYIGISDNHCGYVPQGEEQFYTAAQPDFKEAFDVGFDLGDCDLTVQASRKRPMLGVNRWPETPGFRSVVKSYYQQVYALSQTLFRGFALALGLPEDGLTQLVQYPPSQLRLIHYPFNPNAPKDQPGIGAHTDYECFTILLPTASGLEVQNGAGEWIDAPVLPGTFVINIGDMLEVLSNGRLVATKHRVRKVQEERYSFPLFCACDYDTVIAPLPHFVAQDGASHYAPIVCGDHLYAQTIQTFRYLREPWQRGELQLPTGAKPLDSFGPAGARGHTSATLNVQAKGAAE